MNKQDIVNRLLVETFNRILILEEGYMQSMHVNLSINEIHVLEAIDVVESKTISNVAKKLSITKGSISVSINLLIKKGYIIKTQDANDRRVYHLTLTDEAKNILDIHTKFHNEMICQFFENISDQDQSLIIEPLENINKFFNHMTINSLIDAHKKS